MVNVMILTGVGYVHHSGDCGQVTTPPERVCPDFCSRIARTVVSSALLIARFYKPVRYGYRECHYILVLQHTTNNDNVMT